MGGSSNFPFIENDVLRRNLDEAFDHILILLPFTESQSYNEPAKSAFRKTIIIYTASIVEALLFYILDKKFSEQEVREFCADWKLQEKKVLYVVSDAEKIVAGKYVRVLGSGNKEKMNLGMIVGFLKDKGIVSPQECSRIDTLRNLRNEQHIGTHKKVPVYSKKDLEKAFSVAKEVKELTRIQCTRS